MKSSHSIDFFLGSKTMSGFRSLFDQLLVPEANLSVSILKGGPGTGKSTLIKRVAEALLQKGHALEFIPCASDPFSLDAFVDYESRTAIIDGTAPHLLDPAFPGVAQRIVDLGAAWDGAALLEKKAEIVSLSRASNLCHARASALLAAAGALLAENYRSAAPYVDQASAWAFAKAFLAMPYADPEGNGRERKRLLSAVTPQGVTFFENTLDTLSQKLYVLPDEYGPAAHAILTRLKAGTLLYDLDVISCPCSLLMPEKLEHLLIPEIGTGFTTANAFHSPARTDAATLSDLYRPMPVLIHDGLRRFAEQAEGLVGCAATETANAKALHDELEEIYVQAMDFDKVAEIQRECFPFS